MLRANDETTRHLQNTQFEDIDITEVSLCGCDSCYDKGFSGYIETRTGRISCAQRIMQLIANENTPEEEACRQVAKVDHSDECGSVCDIDMCDGRGTMHAKEKDPPPPKAFCGCKGCNQDVWLAMAGEFSCGARVTWLTGRGQTSAEACRTVAGDEFSDICGACNPDTCEQSAQGHELPEDAGSQSLEFQEPTELEDIPLTPDYSLYCFPPYNDRVRYENVWGKYTLEVKESEHPCGPSDNMFSTRTVHLDDDELTLQFRKVGDRWEGSEVRVLLPWEEMPFVYGDYSFSVKNVKVIDTATGNVVDTVLPLTMILGLFTWDATESYAIHENYNHEVDIEISRWNIEGLADVQYLVQPPGDPHKYRFFSGEGDTYQQAPNTYKFDWRPAEIEWTSSAGGGGHQFTYDAQMALDASAPFYVQCMPADVEVRLNLWNLFGNSAPTGMQDTHQVEVVIDNFEFTPSGLTGLAEGGTCTRDCHCEATAVCRSNKCFSPDPSMVAQPQSEDAISTLPPTTGSASVASGASETNTPPADLSAPETSETNVVTNNPSIPESLDMPETNITKATGTEDATRQSGKSKAGKPILIVFFLALAAALAAFFYMRRKRSETNRRGIIFGSDDSSRKVRVVECYENDTTVASSSSFEVAIPKKPLRFQHE
ncbi:Glycosyl hydrolases family 16 [Seminavis robusta]|uniref:Glycosyl hydrolases family 16 n=1 Tax=Seminavis robusta TaxID=568900 RepID=A0A9N8HKC7_9STRA|nr:Glycosyl hydrolases family 16 [Seminavis robusta]|eukprot:Sro933_g221760.1 Glycosyl hydrolases family 16 (656) ;mRNA; f:12891-15106